MRCLQEYPVFAPILIDVSPIFNSIHAIVYDNSLVRANKQNIGRSQSFCISRHKIVNDRYKNRTKIGIIHNKL